ncbi:MAG TPA: DUF4157 domain-containing protein [Terriglobia bacterium]|nr:DUF4157 domain-containing protein [Terriglobia bacterium]
MRAKGPGKFVESLPSRPDRPSCHPSPFRGPYVNSRTSPQAERAVDSSGIQDVLRSPGQPLDATTRAFFEPRLGHDFSKVRVHTDAKAAESAAAVNAAAYTVGRNVVFGAGRYQPGSSAGHRLIAHELTHVLQQGSSRADHIVLAPTESRWEEEANKAAGMMIGDPAGGHFKPTFSPGYLLHRQLVTPAGGSPVPLAGTYTGHQTSPWPTSPPPPPPQAWSLSGNIATALNHFARLPDLATQVGAHTNDWKCIKPLKMQTFATGTSSPSQKRNYQNHIQPGDQFDVSNLTAQAGPDLEICLFQTGTPDAEVVKRFYPSSAATITDPDSDISAKARDGSTPLRNLLIVGHHSGDHMFGEVEFKPSAYSSEEPNPSYDQAIGGLFPRRCWLTRNASARLVGCSSEAIGQDFANSYLRTGASVTTTTRAVGTYCTVMRPRERSCVHPDALYFAQSSSRSAPSVGGPYTTAGAFQSGPFWSSIKGSL